MADLKDVKAGDYVCINDREGNISKEIVTRTTATLIIARRMKFGRKHGTPVAYSYPGYYIAPWSDELELRMMGIFSSKHSYKIDKSKG